MASKGTPATQLLTRQKVAFTLHEYHVEAAVGGKRAAMADAAKAERATGYVTGGISPFGQRSRLPVVVDSSALDWPTVYVSAGRRGLEVEVAPADLITVTGAATGPIAQPG